MAPRTRRPPAGRWEVATRSPEVERLLARSLGVSRAFAAVLANRGLGNPEHARAFLDPSLGALHDPWLLPDVAAAVERIAAAVKTGERIL
ncbi:MAG: single-stranded-DNA-specific exonuclease RecJ, partial [Armatimonadota bacterium]